MADTPPSMPSDPGSTAAAPANPTRPTRISGIWIAVVIAAVVLVVLLVFILQNTESVKVSFFTVNGSMPLGVALLLAAVGGVLFAGFAASLRIWQLRHRLKSSERPPRSDRILPDGQEGIDGQA